MYPLNIGPNHYWASLLFIKCTNITFIVKEQKKKHIEFLCDAILSIRKFFITFRKHTIGKRERKRKRRPNLINLRM
jgi:hypothetical protein